MRPIEGLGFVLVPNVVLGLPAYFTAFLFAYGFREDVGLAEHVAFLVLIAVFAVVAGLLGAGLSMTRRPRPPTARLVSLGVRLSLALNSAVVGAGSIVSATHKEENSVSAHFSTTTDVLVASGLFLLAAVLAWSALHVDLRVQRGDAGGGPA